MVDRTITSWTRVGDIRIGNITKISYDAAKDLVILIEESGREVLRHIFGSKARELPELIDTLETYYLQEHEERLELFKTIRSKMG